MLLWERMFIKSSLLGQLCRTLHSQNRMADDKEVINFSALERELQSALEADKKYQRENDAKFRALHQKVGTYEEFRDIVLASHLSPLDRKDKTGGPRKQPWNSIASSSSSSSSSSYSATYTHCLENLDQTEAQPSTATELNRSWRHLAGASRGRYRLLLFLGGPGLREIFKAEVGFGLLGEFLVVLCEGLQPGDEDGVMGVLEGLTQTPRFSLNLALLSPAERGACERLLHLLATAAQHSRTDLALHGQGEDRRKGPVEENGGKEIDRKEEGKKRQTVEEKEGMASNGRRERERRGCVEEGVSEDAEGDRDTETINQRQANLMLLYGIQPDSSQQ